MHHPCDTIKEADPDPDPDLTKQIASWAGADYININPCAAENQYLGDEVKTRWGWVRR
jgi:hypothetical protein